MIPVCIPPTTAICMAALVAKAARVAADTPPVLAEVLWAVLVAPAVPAATAALAAASV
jgi:hypothetical protein